MYYAFCSVHFKVFVNLLNLFFFFQDTVLGILADIDMKKHHLLNLHDDYSILGKKDT